MLTSPQYEKCHECLFGYDVPEDSAVPFRFCIRKNNFQWFFSPPLLYCKFIPLSFEGLNIEEIKEATKEYAAIEIKRRKNYENYHRCQKAKIKSNGLGSRAVQ